MPVTFDNTVFNSGQSATGLFALGNFTGANTLSGATPVTLNGTIDQPGSTIPVSLNVLNVGTVSGTANYLGFSNLPGGDYVYYFNANVAGIPTPVAFAVTGAAQLPVLAVTPVNISPTSAPVGPSTPCYAEGTRIRTARGEVAVEDLRVGDEVVTASGALRPITWLGHRVTDCASHPRQETVQPIRVSAGAIAPGMPARDLRVSPDHALFLDDVLVQARFLVNGSTITRDAVASVTYWHVELESHDILIAENMFAESYLDVGNRHSFAEGNVISLRPEFDAETAEGHCAPLVTGGERLRAVRAWLGERARHLGARTTADAALRLTADGIALTPVSVAAGRYVYEVPAGAERLTLVSRASVPAEVMAESGDTRRLGVCLTTLEVDGESLDLDDPRLDAGWHAPEAGWRWNDGAGALPLGRRIAFSAHGMSLYHVEAAAETRQALRMAG